MADPAAASEVAPSLKSLPSGRAGGVYMPPHRIAALRDAITDKSSAEYQRMTWEALRKSINGLINKVNIGNMANIVLELFHENLIRGRGLFCRAILKAQMASPGFTHVYAALIAIINTKLPEVGELLLKRIVIQFRRAFKRNNKVVAVALAKFIAHLVNQQVAHEYISLQLITLLLERPSDDSVEVAIGFVKECGQMLSELSPSGMNAIFDRFRGILHEGDIDKRVQYMIEGLFAVRKVKFADFPAVLPDLDLVRREDQITHEVTLDDDTLDAEELADIFRLDPSYADNEEVWAAIRKEIVGDDEEGGGGGEGEMVEVEAPGDEHEPAMPELGEEKPLGGGAGSGRGEEPPPSLPNNMQPVGMAIADMSETDLINLRRTIYLTIMSSMDFEECAHKLMKLNIPRGAESELANMVIECCSQERTYMRYYGLLGQRFCLISSVYQDAFEAAFAEQYNHIHRLETNKLRNVAKLFAHLLHTDALPWTIFEQIKLNESDTTSSSRIFIKHLVQELSEYLGLVALRDRFADASMQPYYAGIFPKDDPRNTRFSINFFTSIGLGALTDDMRLHLQQTAKAAAEAAKIAAAAPPPLPQAPPAPTAAQKAAAKKKGRGRSRSSSSSGSGSSYSSYTSSSSYTTGTTGSSYSSSSYSSRSSSPSPRREKTTTRGRATSGRARSPSSSHSRSSTPSVSSSVSSSRSSTPPRSKTTSSTHKVAGGAGDNINSRRGVEKETGSGRDRAPPASASGRAPAPAAAVAVGGSRKDTAAPAEDDLMADERGQRPRRPASPTGGDKSAAVPVAVHRSADAAPSRSERDRSRERAAPTATGSRQRARSPDPVERSRDTTTAAATGGGRARSRSPLPPPRDSGRERERDRGNDYYRQSQPVDNRSRQRSPADRRYDAPRDRERDRDRRAPSRSRSPPRRR